MNAVPRKSSRLSEFGHQSQQTHRRKVREVPQLKFGAAASSDFRPRSRRPKSSPFIFVAHSQTIFVGDQYSRRTGFSVPSAPPWFENTLPLPKSASSTVSLSSRLNSAGSSSRARK